jgi:hypothetical protein
VSQPSITAAIASTLLRDQGIQLIWELHLAAAELSRIGNGVQAASLIAIADAAEAIIVRNGGTKRVEKKPPL